MAYAKQNFRNGNILNAGELTHIEEGIVALEQGLEDAISRIPEPVEQATPTISVDSKGLITASATQQAGRVPAGTKTATRQLSTQAAKTITPGRNDQAAVESGRYTTGAVVVKGDTNLVANNIRSGVSIFGVTGTLTQGSGVNAQSKTVTPTKSKQTITPDSGYNALSSVVVNAIPDNYIVPSGTLNITSNGTHDVKSYASVNVNVPASGIDAPDRGFMSRTLDGINTTSISGDAGYYSGVSVNFDSSAIEALIDAL